MHGQKGVSLQDYGRTGVLHLYRNGTLMIPSHYDHMEKTFETLRDIKHERLDKKETKTERRNGKQSK